MTRNTVVQTNLLFSGGVRNVTFSALLLIVSLFLTARQFRIADSDI